MRRSLWHRAIVSQQIVLLLSLFSRDECGGSRGAMGCFIGFRSVSVQQNRFFDLPSRASFSIAVFEALVVLWELQQQRNTSPL
jgi:hypothetical protein